jgi:hypothetical protein
MAEIEGINVPAKVIYDPSGLQQAKDDLAKTGEAAKDAGAKATEGASGFGALTGALTGLLTAGAVIEFMRDAWAEAYENEKAFRLVASAAQTFGHDLTIVRGQTEEFALELMKLTGISNNELVAALGKSYQASGDLEQAMKRTQIASVIAANGYADMASAERIVDEVARGHTMRLERMLHVTVQGNDENEKAVNGLKLLEERFGSLSNIVEDNAREVDRSAEKWRVFKEGIGEGLLNAFVKVKEGIVVLGHALSDTFSGLGTWVSSGAKLVSAYAGYIKDVAAEDANATKNFQDRIAAIGKDFDTKMAASETAAEDRKRAEKWKTFELENNLANQRLKVNTRLKTAEMAAEKQVHDYSLQLLQSEVGATDSALDKLRAEYAVYAKEREQRDLEIWKDGVNVVENLTKSHQIELNKRLAAEKKYKVEVDKILKGITDDFNAEVKKRIDATAKEESAEERIRKSAFDIAKHRRELNLQMEYEIANQGLALAGEMFGKNKAVSVAQATISTYEGAAKALAQGGIYGSILAAIVIALGLVQVAKIVSTEPETGGGKGFDNPANDQAAYWGGRKWARDEIAKFSSGASAGMAGYAAGMGGGSSHTDNRRTYNVHLHGVGLFDPSNQSQMRRLWRGFQSMDRNIEQRVVSGRG